MIIAIQAVAGLAIGAIMRDAGGSIWHALLAATVSGLLIQIAWAYNK